MFQMIKNCSWIECPNPCGKDVKKCDDGSSVKRDSSNNCSFFDCPPEQIFCTLEAKICPDGSGVGRNTSNNCEFDPCPKLRNLQNK